MSENPHDPQHYDAHAGDAYDADPRATDHGAQHGEAGYADEPSGPPYRAIAMVLLSAVVLAIGIGLVQLFGSGNDENPTASEEGTSQVEGNGQAGADGQNGSVGQTGADGQALQPGQVGPDGQPLAPGADGQVPGAPADPNAPAPGQADPAGGQGQSADGSAPNVSSVPVQIYNNSTVTGLAGRTGEQLREDGFAVGDVAIMPSNRGVVAESTAFYGTGPGEQAAAQAIADTLGITAKPRPADMAGDAPGVIVIVTQDLQR